MTHSTLQLIFLGLPFQHSGGGGGRGSKITHCNCKTVQGFLRRVSLKGKRDTIKPCCAVRFFVCGEQACEKEALKEITEIASSEETSTEKYDESIAIQANLEHAQQRIQKGESVAT